MNTATENAVITVRAIIKAPVDKVWDLWTNPIQIIHWCHASEDWHTSYAENDLSVGGKFHSHMEARNGSEGFDFNGKYTHIEQNKQIEYILEDDRKVQVTFVSKGDETSVTEIFDAEQTNPTEMQKAGWQAILDNFKKYAERYGTIETMHFEATIDASPAKVYNTMIGEKTYSEWTAEFNPTSHFEGSWERGSKILFLGTDQNGNKGGMVGRIKENIPNKFVSIEYNGLVQDGKEIMTGEEVDRWAGGIENYSFREVNGKTLLLVDSDCSEQFKSYFLETWPKAIKKLKEMCEK